MSEYDDIIDLPHHVSNRHSRMSLSDRAAQFAPFAALTGFDSEIEETARLTDTHRDLDEEKINDLNDKMRMIHESISEKPEVTFLCFVPDKKKTGGAYLSITGRVRRIDETAREIFLTDGTKLNIDSIAGIDII